MNRILSSCFLLLASGLVAAACSKTVSFDLRECALVSACTQSAGVGSLCEQIQAEDAATSGVPTSLLQCVAGATTCAAIDACIKATPAQAAVCAGSSIARCSGDVLVQCDGSASPDVEDCSAIDQHCFQTTGGAGCGTATCDPSTTMRSCQGDSLAQCISDSPSGSGVLTVTDCKNQFGESCSGNGTTNTCTAIVSDTCAVVAGQAQCVGSGAACDPATSGNTCSGSVISTCTGGKAAQFDCASLGVPVTCKVGSDGAASCVGTGTECGDNTSESCADGVITFCLWGTTTTLDCKSYGLSGCTTEPGEGLAKVVARCTE